MDRPSPPIASSGRTILVVEDEPAVRDLVARVLSRTGHDILVEADPLVALGGRTSIASTCSCPTW